jgi:uncharacterized repeat protein (TIGR02543 family)
MEPKQKTSFRLRCLALLLVVSLLLSTGAFAVDTSADPGFTTNTTAVFADLLGGYDQLTIETYLTGDPVEEEHVKPCDIIFVLDQSRAMNGTQGDTRAEIIEAMGELLDGLAEPTDSSEEHRVAIAGYGRVNVNESLDAYNQTDYPGLQHKGSGISLNTGYYTASGFVSSSGWSEAKDLTSADLPQMPSSYQTGICYDSAFMTLEEAKAVLDPETMLAWYSGASRMDAGLTLAEQLANVAKTQADLAGEDRNLIVCVVASSLPIQNYNSHNVIRDKAVQVAAEQLHDQGATIFALGDYKNSGRDLAEDTEAHFQEVMTGICGSKDTLGTKKEDYFFSLSKSGSVAEALNEMITQITITVAESIMQDATVQVSATDVSLGTPSPTASNYSTWLSKIPLDTSVHIAYYDFKEYADGIPQFEKTPYAELNVSLSSLIKNGSIQYETKLVPIQTVTEASSDSDPSNLADGDKIVITIVNPVTLRYQWVGDVPQDAVLPAAEHVGYLESHAPIEPETQDSHYEFLDWYLDPECTTPVDSSFSPTAQETTLYGKWTRYALVRYYEQLSHTASSEDPNEVQWITLGNTPTTYTPTHTGYEFAGWYTDKSCTSAYTPQAVTGDLDLYAKWTANTYPISVQVVNGTADPSTSPLAVSYGSDQTIAFQPNQGYTLDYVTVDGSSAALSENGTYTFSGVTTNHSILVVYTDDQNGDNIPDKYQVFVSFVSGDTAKGTVTDQVGAAPNTGISQVYTLTDSRGGYAATGSVTPTLAGVSVAPKTGYALDIWTRDGSPEAVSPTSTLTNVQGGTTITYTAHFDTDTIGNGGSDGIPDKYQAIITYKIENGTWDGSSKDDKTCVFTLYEKNTGGVWVEQAPVLGTSIPTGMQPDASHSGSAGTWDTQGLSSTTPVTENRTYTFYYGQINTYTIDVTVIDGTSDPIGPSISVVHGQDQTLRFTPASGYVLDSVTVDGSTASLNAQGEYQFKNVSQNHTIHVVYTPDENNDGIADKYQVFIRFESADQTKGSVTGTGTFQVFTLPAGETHGSVTPSLTDVRVTPVSGYAFDIWTENGSPEAVDPTKLIENVLGGTTITFKAHFIDRVSSTYYTLTYASGGGTKYESETYAAGTSVALSKAPIREGYQFTGWYADKELTVPIDRVLMNADTTVYAGWVASTVPELLNGDDHYAYIVGYEDGTVRPQGNITRAEIAAIFFRLLKEEVRNEYLTAENPFTDVGENAWYCKAVSTLYALGILDGRTTTTFAPNAPITRAELATVCARFDTGITDRNHSFTDISGHWAQDAIEEAAALGWVEGYEDGTFRPDSYITRAELSP